MSLHHLLLFCLLRSIAGHLEVAVVVGQLGVAITVALGLVVAAVIRLLAIIIAVARQDWLGLGKQLEFIEAWSLRLHHQFRISN